MELIKLITTSWDDGNILDFKLAELLNKYNLPATFYIPKTNTEHTVMEATKIVELSKQFEIGGHTLNHMRLHTKNKQFWIPEIQGCFDWLTELTGISPVSFCFPGGVFSDAVINMVFETGFKIARTTELLSIEKKTARLQPTTLQVYEHTTFTYYKHLLKRKRWKNMIYWLRSTSLNNLENLTENYLGRIEQNGGCFHLWGHSWEIEKFDLWKKLEVLFSTITKRPGFTYIANKDTILY